MESTLTSCNRTLTFQLTSIAGFGSEINNLLYAGIYALITNRTFIIESTNWNYGSWNHLFELPTENCSLNLNYFDMKKETASFSSKDVNYSHLVTVRMWGGLYSAISNFPHIYLNVHGHRAVAGNHLKLNSAIKAKVNQYCKEIFRTENPLDLNFKNENLFGFQIRRGDKIPVEKAYPMIDYVEALERLIATTSNSKTQTIKKLDKLIVFVASDDFHFVIPELQKIRPSWKFLYRKSASNISGHNQMKFNQLQEPERIAHTFELLVDLEILKSAKFVVCQYSSNFCRLLQALRKQNPSSIFGLDKNWFKGSSFDIEAMAGKLNM